MKQPALAKLITYDPNPLLATVANAVPDGDGNFLVGFNIPDNAPVGAQLAIAALTGSGGGPFVLFTVT